MMKTGHAVLAAALAIGTAGCIASDSTHESRTEQPVITSCPLTFPFNPEDFVEPLGPPPPTTSIVRDRELIITDPSVVESSCQSGWGGVNCSAALGKWTFGSLMTAMSGETSITSLRARKFVADWFRTWLTQRLVGQDPLAVAARPKIWDKVLRPWLQASGCELPAATDGATRSSYLMNCAIGLTTTSAAQGPLDLQKVPFRLSAIVNRIDLDGRDYQGNGAPGELRFVFNAFSNDVNKSKLNAAVIFEYHFTSPVESPFGLFPPEWAFAFHGLAGLSFGPQFNAQLQGLTDRVVARNAWPGRPNGSAIAHVRTNENAFDLNISTDAKVWEFRQFALSPCTDINMSGFCLTQEAVSGTPRNSDNHSSWLTNFLRSPAENQSKAITGTLVVPEEHLAGSALSPGGPAALVWNTEKDINDPDELRTLVDPTNIPKSLRVRHGFAFSTCNGCHYRETNIQTLQFHISPRDISETSQLSFFLNLPPDPSIKNSFADPNPESEHRNSDVQLFFEYNEIWRRACELRRVYSGSSRPWSTPTGHH